MTKTVIGKKLEPETNDGTSAVTDLVSPDDLSESAIMPKLDFSMGKAVGDIDSNDIIIPKLNMVHGVGELSKTFTPGDLVFNKQVLLAKMGQDIRFTVLSIRKWYQDWLPYGSEVRPQSYTTEEEVKSAGKWTDWREGQKPPVRDMATALLFIEKPEGVADDLFMYEFEGKRFSPSLWILSGTGYTRAAKVIFSAYMFSLKAGYITGSWLLHTDKEVINKNVTVVPVLRQAGKNLPQLQAFITDAMKGGNETQETK